MTLTISKAQVGSNEDTWGTITNTALDAIVTEVNNNADGTNATTPNMTSFQVGGVAVTTTAAEINVLDGNTSATSTFRVHRDTVQAVHWRDLLRPAMSNIAILRPSLSSPPCRLMSTMICMCWFQICAARYMILTLLILAKNLSIWGMHAQMARCAKWVTQKILVGLAQRRVYHAPQ